MTFNEHGRRLLQPGGGRPSILSHPWSPDVTTNPQTDDRRERYATAIRAAGDTAYGNSPFYEAITTAVIAIADAELAAATVPAPAPTDPTHGLSVPHADALWDAVAIPGPTEPSYPAQHERVCRTVAEILTVATASVPAIQAAAVREAADRYATLADQNEAYDREQGDLNEAARTQHETVRDMVVGLRGMADEIEAASGSGRVADETQALPAAELTAAERQFLTFALDQAADEMASRGDEFSDEDEAALETLRRIAAAEPAPPVDRCIHVREIHRNHHTTPVDRCPWCATTQTTTQTDGEN